MISRKLGLALAVSLSLAAGAALAEPSPSKKALIDKLVKLQQPAAEMLARTVVQQPLGQLMQAAGQALQQVPAEKREATAKAMDADVKKFVEDNVAYVRDKAAKMAPTTTAAFLDERFDEDELKQILAWFESPVSKKFGQLQAELNKALLDKVVAEAGPTLQDRFKGLHASLAKQLGVPAPASAPKPAASAPAPAKK
ncbi:MAG: DUF2059 domain-containing protein [Roseateles sp.]|jgi:hypothetical protein|uniref:DUF2059 domain-containing protein n=2 Tax=Pseudomonadota TaxID=1224 RepID=UPI00269EB132|nr:DUF2059 domain-containing protein [Burkholderiaceae bacterium]